MNGIGIREPCSVDELRSLFDSLNKLAHATRVVVSLTEDGEVARKSGTNKIKQFRFHEYVISG